MSSIILREQGSTGVFNIINSDRSINFNLEINRKNIILKSSNRPEWTSEYPEILFLQGESREYDNETITIPRKNLKYFLFAIYQYNQENAPQAHIANTFIETYKFKCVHCNRNKSVIHFHPKHFDYCLECAVNIHSCADCGELAPHKFGSFYYCDNCVVINGYCQNCEEERYLVKSKTIDLPNDYHGSAKRIYLCADCWTQDIYMGREHHYHYTPDTFTFWDYDFRKKKRIKRATPLNNVLYMGTEIEAQFLPKKHTNIVIGKILNTYGRDKEELIYAKHDGTVPDPGSELVTHPMTLSMYRSLTWKGLFDSIIKPESFGIGGHVHLSKTAFVSPIHVYKFCNFLRTNVEYTEWIGERPLQGEWCKAYSGNGKIVQLAQRYKDNENNDRYEMINFTRYTIELRFFWSPSSTAMLLKNVEFIDALYNYTQICPIKFTYQDFENFIEKFSIKYPYLYNFILDRYKKQPDLNFISNSEAARIRSNAEEIYNSYTRATDARVTPTPRQPLECSWCHSSIYGDEYASHTDGRLYHLSCYDDMMDDIEFEEEPYDDDCDEDIC